MSWVTFKQNIIRLSENPNAIGDIDLVAKTYAQEYDACIKRGTDTISMASVKKGNVEMMKTLFKFALQQGQLSPLPYDLVGAMGSGVIAYWSSAVLNEFPIPIIPAPGTVGNIGVYYNMVISPGIWKPAFIIPPTTTPKTLVDIFVFWAQQHLATVTGLIITNSLYPPLSTPAPGVINWTGYKVPNVTARLGAPTSTMLFGGATVVYDGNTLSHKGFPGWHSGNAVDIFTKIGTPCYTPIGGIIEVTSDYGPTVIVKDGKKLFGAGIVIRSEDGRKIYMTHLKNMPKNILTGGGKPILKGTFVGEVMDFPDSSADHLHIGFIDGTSFKDYMLLDGKGTFL
jgi:hypothetical protein